MRSPLPRKRCMHPMAIPGSTASPNRELQQCAARCLFYGGSRSMLRRDRTRSTALGRAACVSVRPTWVCIINFRSEEHTSELQSLMRISYAVFCLKKKNNTTYKKHHTTTNTQEQYYNKNDTTQYE